jgi:hypothetical protein
MMDNDFASEIQIEGRITVTSGSYERQFERVQAGCGSQHRSANTGFCLWQGSKAAKDNTLAVDFSVFRE